jgi:hypothetical protein
VLIVVEVRRQSVLLVGRHHSGRDGEGQEPFDPEVGRRALEWEVQRERILLKKWSAFIRVSIKLSDDSTPNEPHLATEAAVRGTWEAWRQDSLPACTGSAKVNLADDGNGARPAALGLTILANRVDEHHVAVPDPALVLDVADLFDELPDLLAGPMRMRVDRSYQV